MSELENARLVRLLCKFGFINERPEYASASSIGGFFPYLIAKFLATDLLVSHDGLKLATDILSNYSAISSSIK
jgi:hypothetical protein